MQSTHALQGALQRESCVSSKSVQTTNGHLDQLGCLQGQSQAGVFTEAQVTTTYNRSAAHSTQIKRKLCALLGIVCTTLMHAGRQLLRSSNIVLGASNQAHSDIAGSLLHQQQEKQCPCCLHQCATHTFSASPGGSELKWPASTTPTV